jgi:hypothetical protein
MESVDEDEDEDEDVRERHNGVNTYSDSFGFVGYRINCVRECVTDVL